MYLYNTTFLVDLSLNNDFIYYIKEEIKPSIITFEGVKDVIFFELLNVDASEGNTFCLHIYFLEMVNYNQYKIEFENIFLNNIYKKYNEKVLFFSSILKSIE